jgi:hypothetical protein
MSFSDQVDAVQKRATDLKNSFDVARHETNEQVKARIGRAKSDIEARESDVKEKTGQAADHAQSQWKSLKDDAASKVQNFRDRIDRRRDEHDVKMAEKDAEAAEEDAADALDYATWVIEQAQLAVLVAIDARSYANARAAQSPAGLAGCCRAVGWFPHGPQPGGFPVCTHAGRDLRLRDRRRALHGRGP